VCPKSTSPCGGGTVETVTAVREAEPADDALVGQLLHDFNTEFGDPAPEPLWLARRARELIQGGETVVLVVGRPPAGLALLRFRPALWSPGTECYLAELYVRPSLRGQGLGEALLQAAVATARHRGADYIDLGTAETDTAARGLYEKLGFRNRENRDDGPIMYVYEKDL